MNIFKHKYETTIVKVKEAMTLRGNKGLYMGKVVMRQRRWGNDIITLQFQKMKINVFYMKSMQITSNLLIAT